MYYAHETAVIDQPCEIGEGTKIWHYTHIMAGAKIGKDCVIGQNVFVSGVVGDGCKIQNNVSIYNGVVLYDQVFCGPSVVFTNVINPRSFVDRKDEFKPTEVGFGATLGANSTIICGVTIGAFSMVGAGAVVSRSVKQNALVIGIPARQTGWVCICGTALPKRVPGILECIECGRRFEDDGDLTTL